jgi:hypothetical protein
MRNGHIKVKTLSFFNVKMNEKCNIVNIVNHFSKRHSKSCKGIGKGKNKAKLIFKFHFNNIFNHHFYLYLRSFKNLNIYIYLHFERKVFKAYVRKK